jgi:AcrR family transcriptional regulator
MARPSAAERRIDYLDIGAMIVSEFSEQDAAAATVEALANVRVADVAERAGVSKGSIYHIWPTQEAYRHDLLERLLEQSRQAGVRELARLLDDPEVLTQGPRRAMQAHADFVFETLKDDPAFFARFSFFIYASNPAVAELLARGDDAVTAEFAPFMESYIELLGRRIRPPFTIELLLTSINSLFQGLCLRYRTSPDLVDKPALGGDDDGPSMYAFGLDALVRHFSEPVASADAESHD